MNAKKIELQGWQRWWESVGVTNQTAQEGHQENQSRSHLSYDKSNTKEWWIYERQENRTPRMAKMIITKFKLDQCKASHPRGKAERVVTQSPSDNQCNTREWWICARKENLKLKEWKIYVTHQIQPRPKQSKSPTRKGRTHAERVLMKSSVRKALWCKRSRQCGLIANGRSQAYQDFSCVRNINCCFARCAATRKESSL